MLIANCHGKNTLVILVDDLNDFWFLDPVANVTPQMNRISQKPGVTTFRNARANGCICSPSRTTMMTGKYPTVTGVILNTSEKNDVTNETIFVMETLKNSNVTTGGVGKILHNPQIHKQFKNQVWDQWYTVLENQPDPTNLCPGINDNFVCGQYPNSVESLLFPAKALNVTKTFIQSTPEPWFFGFGLKKPHVPLYSPQKYWNQTEAAAFNYPAINTTEEFLGVPERAKEIYDLNSTKFQSMLNVYTPFVHAYMAAVAYSDEYIGQLWDFMEANGHLDDTMIIITSDHGFHLGDKNHVAKTTLYYETVRVPLMIYMPLTLNKIQNTPVSLVDIYPTIINWTGVQQPASNKYAKSAINLIPLLLDPLSITLKRKTFQQCVGSDGTMTQSVYANRYSLITYHHTTNSSLIDKDLYDIQNDPDQRVNLNNDKPGIVDGLYNQMVEEFN